MAAASDLVRQPEEAPLCQDGEPARAPRPRVEFGAPRKAAAALATSSVLFGLAFLNQKPGTLTARTADAVLSAATILAEAGGDVETSGFMTSAEGTKYFAWTEPTRTVYAALYDAVGQDGVNGQAPMDFKEGKGPKRKWNQVAAWVEQELLKKHDPFAAHGGKVPVPWPEGGDGGDQLKNGQWVGYSRRQVCYIAAKSLIGAKTQGYWNGLARYMEKTGSLPFQGCMPRSSDFGKAWWALLAACSADPGLADGGQGPMLLVTKAKPKPEVGDVRAASEKVKLSKAGLRVCRYDDGGKGAGPPGDMEAVPEDGCAQPTAGAPGRDFMTGGLAKQATQDISAAFLGGYVFGNACGLGGGQDERLMVYFPEVSVLTFFLSQAADDQKPQLRQPSWVLGARKMLYGLDGTARFNNLLAFDAGVPLKSDLVDIELKGKKYSIGSSRPFLAFMSENQDFIPWAEVQGQKVARSNKDARQREVSPSSSYAFEKQVRAWYGSVALTSYAEDMQPILKKLVGSIGVGPWLSGLWWGDSQLGLLAVWLGHAMAAPTWGDKFPLDYYLYSAFTENPGNQCFVHSNANCRACLKQCHGKPLPQTSYWLPNGVSASAQDPCVASWGDECGQKGMEDVAKAYASKPASKLWEDVEAKLRQHQGDVSRSVFDMLLE